MDSCACACVSQCLFGLLCLCFSVFVWTLVLALVFLSVCMDSCACACVSRYLYGLLCLHLCFSVFAWTLVRELVFLRLYKRLSGYHLLVRGTKRLVSISNCSVEGNSAGVFVSKVSPGILVVQRKRMPIIFGVMKLPFWVR